MLYENVADTGWVFQADPFDVYVIISNRRQRSWDLVREELEKLILKKTIRRQQSQGQRWMIAESLKNIPVINAMMHSMYDIMRDKSVELVKRRERYRRWKRLDPRFSEWYNKLFS